MSLKQGHWRCSLGQGLCDGLIHTGLTCQHDAGADRIGVPQVRVAARLRCLSVVRHDCEGCAELYALRVLGEEGVLDWLVDPQDPCRANSMGRSDAAMWVA